MKQTKRTLAIFLALVLTFSALVAIGANATGTDYELEARRLRNFLLGTGGGEALRENAMISGLSADRNAHMNEMETLYIRSGIRDSFGSGHWEEYVNAVMNTQMIPLIQQRLRPDYIAAMLLVIRVDMELQDAYWAAGEPGIPRYYEIFNELDAAVTPAAIQAGQWTEILAFYTAAADEIEAIFTQHGIAFPPRWDPPFAPNFNDPATTTTTTTATTTTTVQNTTTTATTVTQNTTTATGTTQPSTTTANTIFGTNWESNFLNWFLFIVGFGWLWMWF